MNKICIHTLKDPRDGSIRYVGKTNKPRKRFIGHLADARVKRYNNHNCKWISSLLKENLEPIMEMHQRCS